MPFHAFFSTSLRKSEEIRCRGTITRTRPKLPLFFNRVVTFCLKKKITGKRGGERVYMPNKFFFKERESNIGGGKIFFRRGGGQIFFLFFFFFERAHPSHVQKNSTKHSTNQNAPKLHNSQNRKFVGAAITVTKNTPLNGFL